VQKACILENFAFQKGRLRNNLLLRYTKCRDVIYGPSLDAVFFFPLFSYSRAELTKIISSSITRLYISALPKFPYLLFLHISTSASFYLLLAVVVLTHPRTKAHNAYDDSWPRETFRPIPNTILTTVSSLFYL